MDTLVQVGHILKYVALISGFCLFLQNVREKNDDDTTVSLSDILDSLKPSSYKNNCSYTTFVILIVSLHTAVSLAPPSFQIHYRDDIIHLHMNLSIVGNSYGAMAILTHIANVLTGSAMVVATIVIIKLWRNGPPDPNESDAVGKRFNHLIDNYQKKW